MAINVNRENPDQFYRYKMPPLVAKVEGKGNGIKTVIVNAEAIGKALERPPTYVCKFFGCELGAQTQMDIKNSRYIVNGAHEEARLQDLLDGFIKKFVLCPECENPETYLTVSASKTKISQDCAACGYHGILDMRHKLTTYIVNNPPGQSANAGNSGKKGRKGKKGQQQQRKGKESPTETPTSPKDSPFDNATREGKSTAVNNVNDDVDEEEWSVDTSEDAVKARMEKMSNGVASLTMHTDLEKSSAERVDLFYKFSKGIISSGGVARLAKDLSTVKAEAERLDMFDKAAGILAELLFDKDILNQITLYRPIFLQFVYDKTKAQRHLLEAVEGMIATDHPELMSKVPHILKALYDADLVEEEAFFDWHGKVHKKQLISAEVATKMRSIAEPIIEWLRNAEEESSSDDEVEVVYSDKQQKNSGGIVVQEEAAKNSDENVDDDIDIEAI